MRWPGLRQHIWCRFLQECNSLGRSWLMLGGLSDGIMIGISRTELVRTAVFVAALQRSEIGGNGCANWLLNGDHRDCIGWSKVEVSKHYLRRCVGW
jgi:hypothetical protein